MPIVQEQEMTSIEQLRRRLQADPAAGRCTLRAEASWDGSFRSRVVPEPRFRGSGGACLYAEELLEILAKCVAYDVLGHAADQCLAVAGVWVSVAGDVDFAGSVGLDAPAGFQQLRITLEVDADARGGALERLAAIAQRTSVVGQSLAAVPQVWSIAQKVVA